ncbi:MAG: putative glycosyl transferase [Firmicutes bacterium]|nr:putative glycosyl transferase [Bacillota bacterium]
MTAGARQPVQKPLLIQAILGETKVCSRVRISEPHAFCQTIPGVRTIEQPLTADLNVGLPGEDKVFIWQRTWPQNMEQQQMLIKRNYLTVAEIDDDPLRWREYHEGNDFFAFRACHAVQTSTEPLAEYLRQFNPHVAVFPNQIAYLPPPRRYDAGKPITLFFGALNREQDWQDIIPVLNGILAQWRSKVVVQVIHDRLFFDALQTPYKEFIPFCQYEEYQQMLHAADIALLPLSPTRFNSMKSDLKFLECAAHGVVALASPTVYEATIVDGITGLIYHTPEEFAQYLQSLLEGGQWRHRLAGKAYEWVKTHRLLGAHYHLRIEWYNNLLNNYGVLTEEIYRRLRRN